MFLPCSLFSCFSPLLGERDRVGQHAFNAIACLSCMYFFLSFSLPLVSDVGCGM